MKISRIALVGLALAVAGGCSSEATGPGGGGIKPYVGEWCAKTGTFPHTNGSTITYTNTTSYQDVAGSDGIVRRQEVRGCRGTIKLPNR